MTTGTMRLPDAMLPPGEDAVFRSPWPDLIAASAAFLNA
jgi:hypothetical protein